MVSFRWMKTISLDLRERILAVAAELGYLGPDPSARSLATGTTGTIGVLWAKELRYSLADEVSARFLGAVADELAPSGLALTLVPAIAGGSVVPARDVAEGRFSAVAVADECMG